MKKLQRQFKYFFVFMIHQKENQGQKYCHGSINEVTDHLDFIENSKPSILCEV